MVEGDNNEVVVREAETVEIDIAEQVDNISLVQQLHGVRLKIPNTIPTDFFERTFPKSGLILFPDARSQPPAEDIGSKIVMDGQVIGYRIQLGDREIINLDHHAHTPEMEKEVSATVFSIRYAQGNTHQIGKEIPIVITHLDADSILSAMVLGGRIPDELYKECAKAAVDADHTGNENELADLMMSVEEGSTLQKNIKLAEDYFAAKKKPGFNFESFVIGYNEKFGEGKTLFEKLHSYRQSRKTASTMFDHSKSAQSLDHPENIKDGLLLENDNGISLYKYGKVYLVQLKNELQNFESSFARQVIPPNFPPGEIVIVCYPTNIDGRQRYMHRLRTLHAGAPNLTSLGLEEGLNFGGRFNAGSNRRKNGSELSGIEAAMLVDKKLQELGV